MNSNDTENPREAALWTRKTPWRQGGVLSPLTALSLGLIEDDEASNKLVVVISHTCDIVKDDLEAEPDVEVIVGELLTEPDPNLTYAKSPNRLHLAFAVDGELRFIALQAKRKKTISKAALASQNPDFRFELDAKSLTTLQHWLASRYKRAAFPDALQEHFKNLDVTLEKSGAKRSDAIIGFYIDYEPDEEISDPEEPYEVRIEVVFDPNTEDSAAVAEEVARKILERARSKFETESGWRKIELRECRATASTHFSLDKALRWKLYRLDHVSLKPTEDQGKIGI